MHDMRDLEVLKNRTAEKQEPFAAVLACADSRVPVELIFDQTIGQGFVTRRCYDISLGFRPSDLFLSERPAQGPAI